MVSVKQRLYAIFLALLFAPLIVWADGKVFTRAVAVPTTTPDQRALLYFSNGLEKLVIETSFIGEGTNFAWVVPLPSVPKVEAVGENFFASLSSAYQPKLLHEETGLTPFFLFVGGCMSLALYAYRARGRNGCLLWVGFMVFVLLCVTLVVPMGVKSRGLPSGPTASVTILDQQRAGIFDTITLSSTDEKDLLQWLNSHGFHVPTNALPVLKSYVANQWVFVGTTINRDSAASQTKTKPHPLAFTFKTSQAIYPLALTGVENGACNFELFVFGPSKAASPHFATEYCGKPFRFTADETRDFREMREHFYLPKPGEFRIADNEVASFAFPAPVTTKLIGTLSPSQMRSDALISWEPYEPLYPVLYSKDAAKSRGWDWFSGLTVLGWLTLQIASTKLSRKAVLISFAGVTLFGAALGFIQATTLKTIDMEIVQGAAAYPQATFHGLWAEIELFAYHRRETQQLTFEALLAELENGRPGSVVNCFDGKPLRNSPTPGNITLRNSDKGTEVLWYDINANPHVLAKFQ